MSKSLLEIHQEMYDKEHDLILNILEEHKISSLTDLDKLGVAELFPEYNFPNESIGYYDPYNIGNTGDTDFTLIGQGGSLLSILPFYDRVLVRVVKVPQADFHTYYGVTYDDFVVLIDSQKIMPLLPERLDYMLMSRENASYLSPLYGKGYPMDTRKFYLHRTLLLGFESANDRMESVKFFQQYVMETSVKIFKDNLGQMNFFKRCNRAIYRGDPYLVFTWISLSIQLMDFFKNLGADYDAAQDLTNWFLESKEPLLSFDFRLKGLTTNYSRVGYDWVKTESISKIKLGIKYGQGLSVSELHMLKSIFPMLDSNFYDDTAILRDNYLYEPIEAVGDIRKYIYWMEKSNNVRENSKILKRFNEYIEMKEFREASIQFPLELKEVVKEINKEIKRIKFQVKTTKKIIEVGTIIGTTIAGKYIGSALTDSELTELFSMCGALAGLTLANKSSDTIAEKITRFSNKSNLPFLLWKEQEK